MGPLGKTQVGVLRALITSPYGNGDWMWENHSTTERILRSLAKRGLVTIESSEFGALIRADITDAGRIAYNMRYG
jgi:DNA-binding PadR family transcriptional regulator